MPRPLVPGAEIHPDILHPGVLEREEGVRGARALEAVEIDRGVRADPDGGAFGQNLLLGLEAWPLRSRLHHAVPFQPDGAGDPSLARAKILAIGRRAFADPLI